MRYCCYFPLLFFKGFLVSVLVLFNNFSNIFIFCINIDIDEVLLLEKNKGLGLIPLQLFPFVILDASVHYVLVSASYFVK